MASITSLGVGSNLDLNTLIKSLETSEKQPLVALKNRAASYTTKLSAYGKLQDSLGTLQTAATKLGQLSLFEGVKASSSFSTVLTASATTSASGGNYAINVSQLAQSQSLATLGQTSATAAIGTGGGTITVDFGTLVPEDVDLGTAASFSVNAARTPASIVLGDDANTLEGIRDAVNAANAGVTASIVNDGSGAPNRLVLVSSETGEASSMRISVAGGNTELGELLTHDPVAGTALQETAAAKDAKLTVNGLQITSATNTVDESLQGVTLTLVKAGETTLSVARDTSSVSSAINAFVSAYNGLLSTGKSLTSYDLDTQTGSALTGDATLRNMQVRLRSVLTQAQAGGSGEFTMLSNIGLEFQKDGSLSVDAAKLEQALDNQLDSVARLFAGAAGDAAGYGKQLAALATSLTSRDGALNVATEGVTSAIKQLDKQYDAMEMRMDSTVARYRAQFTQLDVLMSTMNSTSNYLTQQFEAMTASLGK